MFIESTLTHSRFAEVPLRIFYPMTHGLLHVSVQLSSSFVHQSRRLFNLHFDTYSQY